MLWFHVVFLFKCSCNFTYDNKIILNQKNEGSQFRHRHNNTANSYIFTNSYRNSTFNSSFVTGYVNANYHPCGNNTGIFPGAIYIKNGMKCNNEYISRKEDSAVK